VPLVLVKFTQTRDSKNDPQRLTIEKDGMNGIGKCFNKFQQINIINFWQRCASCRKSGYAAVSGDSFPKIITSWWSTNSGNTFGTRESQVQILPLRPLNPLILNAFSKTVYSHIFHRH
jgi:hypothetical protein